MQYQLTYDDGEPIMNIITDGNEQGSRLVIVGDDYDQEDQSLFAIRPLVA